MSCYRGISTVFCKTFKQTGHFHFDNLWTKTKTKLCCLSWFVKVTCRRFIWVCFCCSRSRSYKIIPRNCIRNNFIAPEQPCVNKFFVLLLTFFQYGITESTQLLPKCDVWSDLDTCILQERIDWEQSSNYGAIVFPKHNIVCWIMLVVMGVILLGNFEYFFSTYFKYSAN